MDRAVANASQSWFLALKLPVPLNPLARSLVCPDLAEPMKILYMTEDWLPIVAAHHPNSLLAEPCLTPAALCCLPLVYSLYLHLPQPLLTY